jgi:hypothetical protein
MEDLERFTKHAQDVIAVFLVVSRFPCSIPFAQISFKVSTCSVPWDVGVGFLCLWNAGEEGGGVWDVIAQKGDAGWREQRRWWSFTGTR